MIFIVVIKNNKLYLYTQGKVVGTVVYFPLHVPCPFASAPVYDMSLTHRERLCLMGCGLRDKLILLLLLGVGSHFDPQSNRRACNQMMLSIAHHVAAGLVAATRDKAAKAAEELCASGQCAAAVVPLQRAIYLGDLPSHLWLIC
jgi:hypothetical protein